MAARLTTYAYPWDLARLGVEPTLRAMVDEGFAAVELASTYHPIDGLAVRGRSPRLYTDARGAVYFPARPARYGRIRPATAPAALCAVWPEVARHAPSVGIAVGAWTVTLFQPWMVDAHPDCARVLPSGDRVGSGVCAANEHVREYVAALATDIVDQFSVELVHLEGIAAPAFDFDWLRPRILTTLTPLARELLGVCCCRSCVRRGIEAGLDVERLRRVLDDAVAAEIAAPGSAAVEAVGADEELRAFVVQHERASTELATLVAAGVGGDARVSVTAWTPFTSLLAGEERALLAELADAVDEILVLPGWYRERSRLLAEHVSRDGVACRLAMLVSGLSGEDGERPRELTEAAELGVDDFAIYNYALLREPALQARVAAIRRWCG